MGEEVKEKKPNKYVEGFKGFCTFLYNPDDHTVFGRGGSSWGKILIFYFFFYSCLAGFFAVCLTVMLQTLDPNIPTVVGRTNKPMVSSPNPDLYVLNFKDSVTWEKYKEAFKQLQEKYGNNTGTGFFVWDQETVGSCREHASAVMQDRTGCFFVGLNRIYNWNIPDGKELSFDCAWDKGKTGSGNMDPPFNFELLNTGRIGDDLKAYYPWTKMEDNGLQPLQAIKITRNADKMSKMTKDDSLDTYLVCNAYVKAGEEERTILEGSRPANFEIKYALPGGTADED